MKKSKVKSQKSKVNRGMTLFIAIIIMSILLLITFAVANIAVRSTIFASSGRDSQHAFYAADAGIECAFYWDSRFETSKFDPSTPGGPITCSGTEMDTGYNIEGTTTIDAIIGGDDPNITSIFGIEFDKIGNNPVDSCAIVTVTKNANGTTLVHSRGYNTCDTGNSKRIERGIEVTY